MSEDRFEVGFHHFSQDGNLVFYRRGWTEVNSITPAIEVLADADAFEFDHRLFFVGGVFTPLSELAHELDPDKLVELRSDWVYARLQTRSGHEVWLNRRAGQYHIGLDADGKLVIPMEYQDREIVRIAHNNMLYGNMNLDQALEVMAKCRHEWADHDEDLGGATPWECVKCGLGYAIDYYDETWEGKIHARRQSNWLEEVREAGLKYPGLIYTGIYGIAIGNPQRVYATPAVPGFAD